MANKLGWNFLLGHEAMARQVKTQNAHHRRLIATCTDVVRKGGSVSRGNDDGCLAHDSTPLLVKSSSAPQIPAQHFCSLLNGTYGK